MYVNRKKYVLKLKLSSKFNVDSSHQEMWTSLCNFLSKKLFHPQKEFGFQRSDSNECIYGKRLKLFDRSFNANGVASQNSTSLSMQKDNVEISDDDEECCIIAEIPRNKKTWTSKIPEKKPEPASSGDENIDGSRSLSTVILRKSPLDNISNASKSQFPVRKLWTNDATKVQGKKFFMSQRVCRSQGKVPKPRLSYKSYLRRRMSFLQESYRLTEKLQYIQLLQSHTTFNLLTVKPAFKSIKAPPKPIEVIDLTDEKPDDVNDLCNLESGSKSEEHELQIVKEISRVRSFQDLLKARPVTTDRGVKKLLFNESEGNSDIVNLSKLSETINLDVAAVDNDYNCLETDADCLEEELHNFMLISTPAVQEVKDTYEKCSLVELSYEQLRKIKNALKPEPSDEVLSEGFGLQIKRRDIQTLFGLNWLNDEIINFYYNLIMARSESNSKLPKVYAFNTFFYPNLVTAGYSSIKRWTKRVDIFSYDIIIVPIHLGMHWCMSVIDFRNKSVRYYDSIGSPNDSCLERLLFYLEAESSDKRKIKFSTVDWEKSNVSDIPQQMNGADCGVFSCMFAEYLTRDCNISFTQEDMPYFRKKIIIEILEKKLLT